MNLFAIFLLEFFQENQSSAQASRFFTTLQFNRWRNLHKETDSGNEEINNRAASLADRIKQKFPQEKATKQRPSIMRVHAHLRNSETGAYEPKLVSIGPLHHNKEELLPMEEVKRAYLCKLLARSKENSLERYVERILLCLPQVKLEYSEKIEFSDDDLFEMLVVDGCFIIEYFARRLFHTNYKMPFLPNARWGFSHLNRDLMLLENQIPFFVLSSLFKETIIPIVPSEFDNLAIEINMPEKKKLDFMMLAIAVLHLELPSGCPKDEDVWHLLHLRHLCMNPLLIEDSPKRSSTFKQIILWPFKKLSRVLSIILLAVFYLIFFRDLSPILGTAKKKNNQSMTPSATELLQAGIKFKSKIFHEYKNASQLKLSLREGTLEIPFMLITDHTSSHLRNLVALEQCCRHIEKTHFTSYCAFMNNIIDGNSDVAILKSSGILESMLGNDSEVAELFNSLCREVNIDTDEHYNKELFTEVREFSEVAHHRWRAELVSKGFKSPWTFISLIGGIALLLLTVTQTFFTVFPRT